MQLRSIYIIGFFFTAVAVAQPVRHPLDEIVDGPNSFTLRNVTLFDGQDVQSNAVVVVKDGFIFKVCHEDEKNCPMKLPTDLDGDNGFVMPSLIDSEGHFSQTSDMLRDLIGENAPLCYQNEGIPSKSALFFEFSNKNLFQEINYHGLFGYAPVLGKLIDIPQSANYEKHLRFGVTTVFDMHSNPWPASFVLRSNGKWGEAVNAEQRDLKKQFLIYADLFYPSMWATPENLQFHYYGVDPVYNLQPVGPWTEQDITNWVQRRKNEGASYIKIFYSGTRPPPNTFTQETLNALVASAHHLGLLAVSHLQSEKLIENVIKAGVDGIVHVPGDNRIRLTSDQINAMKSSLRFDISTLQAISGDCQNPYRAEKILANVLNSIDILPYINALDEIRLSSCTLGQNNNANYEILMQNFADLADAGLVMIPGVDAGDEIASLVEGLGVHIEMYMMKLALQKYSKNYSSNYDSTLYALRAATSAAAKSFGLHIENQNVPSSDPRGFIKAGYRADMLMLEKSPFENITNTLKIKNVWKAGYKGFRQMVRPTCIDSTCESRQIIFRAKTDACK